MRKFEFDIEHLVTVTIGFAFCFVIFQIGSCEIKSRMMISNAIDRGVDPILSACAINGNEMSAVCISRIAQVEKTVVNRQTEISGATIEMNAEGAPAFQFGEAER